MTLPIRKDSIRLKRRVGPVTDRKTKEFIFTTARLQFELASQRRKAGERGAVRG
jgi:hypothetical protein